MLMTAAGTVRPAHVLVLGAGVAGLQAIGTARRLGAVVTGYDVREAARADIASTGASVLDLRRRVGRPARAVTPGRSTGRGARRASRTRWPPRSARFDVVITTAQVPGRHAAGAGHRRGAGRDATRLGGGRPGRQRRSAATWPARCPSSTVVTDGGVTVVGAGNLAARGARGRPPRRTRATSSRCWPTWSRDGRIVLDPADEITAGVLVTHDGEVVHPAVRDAAERRVRMSPLLFADITVFVLSLLVGFEVISKVPATLHTPLMSGANAIHGVVLVGVMLLAATSRTPRWATCCCSSRRRSRR